MASGASQRPGRTNPGRHATSASPMKRMWESASRVPIRHEVAEIWESARPPNVQLTPPTATRRQLPSPGPTLMPPAWGSGIAGGKAGDAGAIAGIAAQLHNLPEQRVRRSADLSVPLRSVHRRTPIGPKVAAAVRAPRRLLERNRRFVCEEDGVRQAIGDVGRKPLLRAPTARIGKREDVAVVAVAGHVIAAPGVLAR